MTQFPAYADIPKEIRPWFDLMNAAYCGAEASVAAGIRRRPPSPKAMEAILLAVLSGGHEIYFERLLLKLDFALSEDFYQQAGRLVVDDGGETLEGVAANHRSLLLLVRRQTALSEKRTICQHLTSHGASLTFKVLVANYLTEQLSDSIAQKLKDSKNG